ncbi:MAG: DEAD/DEAH box helicase family protein [Sediminibacterium sp.]|nr:DEAD/DEAH box helicase family protein [Sediminibacterium sp.]
MNETETKAEFIDPALKAAGWGILIESRIRREYPINKGRLIGNGYRNHPDKADYVLQYKNRNLAIIEAKHINKYYTEGAAQAKKYAEKLDVRFAFSTNGIKIYRIDILEGIEGDIPSFPTPDELWNLTFPASTEPNAEQTQTWLNKFLSIPFEVRGGTWQPRYYQEIAICKVLEAIAKNQQRILLTLATGTGKTAIAFQIAWKLFQTRWNIKKDQQRSPRILYLSDRNILANQAFNDFSVFKEDALIRINPNDIKKKGRVPKNGTVFFTIYQTFMSGPNNAPYFGDYPNDFFDFIIIDECHRGGANDESIWHEILTYFSPAVQLGLTATPKRNSNVDTYIYFGDPVYVYSLKDGINDGFLTPFKVKQIESTLDEYVYSPDDIILEGEVQKDKRYTEAEMNRKIQIMEREKYRVDIFMGQINQKDKTLVFCANQIHALAIRDLINQKSYSKKPNYCHRVTADDGKLGEQHLSNFQDNEKILPTILTTSHKLSTGVDAPEVRNIVLLRPIKSMIEFKQIIGRGTRLFDGKDYFTIYDFVKAHKHFNDPEWDGEPEEPVIKNPNPCINCGQSPCSCDIEKEPKLCPICGYSPCCCENPLVVMTKVKLADGKYRQIQHRLNTLFFNEKGKSITAEDFLHSLFGTLPALFKNEEELRTIWSMPDTRKKLLTELSDNGFSKNHLQEFQKVINAENNDLYDVLAYIAFNSNMLERATRADKAKYYLNKYEPKQQEFLNFVLNQYILQGEDELDDSKISDLLILKYEALDDAKKILGDIDTIRNIFIGFQSYLYHSKKAG